MDEMTPFAGAGFKVQFRTSLPSDEETREEREQEFSALLNQIQAALRTAIESSATPGWEVALVEETSSALPGSARPTG